MPLSSVFEKLKIRRGSNPPSPTSSSINNKDRRQSVDQPRRSSNLPREQDHAPVGGTATYGDQTPVGDYGHIDGRTEVARNVNGELEHGSDRRQPHQYQQPRQHQQQPQEHYSQPRQHEQPRHASRDSSSVGPGPSPNAGGDKGLPPIPVVTKPERTEYMRDDVRGDDIPRGDRDDREESDRIPVVASQTRDTSRDEFDADGFPIVSDKTSHQAVPLSKHTSRSSSSRSSEPAGLPRSHGTFALPTVPQTPAFSDEIQAGLLDRAATGPSQRERFESSDPSVMGYVPVDAQRLGLGFGHGEQGRGVRDPEWRESGTSPLDHDHSLVQPRQLAPYTVPDTNVVRDESRRFVTAQSQVQRQAGSIDDVRSAYVPVREYAFHPSPPGADEPSAEHLQRHLALLSRSFDPTRLRHIAASKPGKYVPLIPGIPVSTDERDTELINQRQGLVGRIVDQETEAERSGARGVKAKDGLDERSVDIFKKAGWESRIGVLDTVDVRTRVLPPVIQEHIVPIETEVFELMIFRDIHKYHIYPYIQPIHDPEPTVLPTRHLFKDAQGQWREVLGDEAAERVLGTRIDRSEGTIYQERWIESVSGIEYEAVERESVIVGRQRWVGLVGEHLVVGGHQYGSTSSRTTGGMRTAAGNAMHEGEQKTRKSSFSSTSPGRPVGHKSSRDAPPVSTGQIDSYRSSGHIGRAL